MICVKCTAFCDLRADLRIRLATLSQVRAQVLVCKLALTCIDLRCKCPEQYEKRTYFSPLENELYFFKFLPFNFLKCQKYGNQLMMKQQLKKG